MHFWPKNLKKIVKNTKKGKYKSHEEKKVWCIDIF